MTQILGLEKGTPQLKVLKDTSDPWLSILKPSPNNRMIKRAYIDDVGQRHVRRKLNYEEPHRLETPTNACSLRALPRRDYTNMDDTLDDDDGFNKNVKDTKAINSLKRKIDHFKENVRPIIGKYLIFIHKHSNIPT